MDIIGFAEQYARSDITRFHMPGHKGKPLVGAEPLDITEISGADSLYAAEGIIAESERKTSAAFGSARSLYSAEGSSLSIKSALLMLRIFFGRKIRIAAARNCHRAFIDGCALTGAEAVWIYPQKRESLCTVGITPSDVGKTLELGNIDCVYITSPDYYGSIADISQIARQCHQKNALLIVDNAHGAYLAFADCPAAMHPLALGADIVCDSAHKTLPVYTGGAYLHISADAPSELCSLAKPAMAMLGSTSPSYLILASLDNCAQLLHGSLPDEIKRSCRSVSGIKKLMSERGIPDLSAEPLKITIDCAAVGYYGYEFADMMRESKMECEYSDKRAVVLMLSPYNTQRDLTRLEDFLQSVKLKDAIRLTASVLNTPLRAALSIRQASLSACELLPAADSVGRICARPALNCQPSVAAVMPGEIITRECADICAENGIDNIAVVKEQ